MTIGAHEYWRLWVHASNETSGTCVIGEVELRDAIGGSDLTGSGLGTASSTGGNWTNTPAAAFDNNANNYYESNSWYNWYLQYRFNDPAEVLQAAITSPTYANGNPRHLSLDYSDDGFDWFRAASYADLLEWTAGETRVFDGAHHHDWTFGRTDYNSSTGVEICQLDKLAVSKFTLTEPAIINYLGCDSQTAWPLTIGGHTYAFKIKGVIYDDDGASGYPGTLLASTAERTSIPALWFKLSFASPVILPPGDYYLGVHVGGETNSLYQHTGFNTGTNYTVSATYTSGVPGTFPGSASTFSRQMGIYAVYPRSLGDNTLADAVSDATGTVGAAGATGTAANTLAALTGTATGAHTQWRQQICLGATWRRQIGLNGTWVGL
jgi:hypothetical protein